MPPELHTALNLDKKGMVSIIGAGGKTSLMFRLAAELISLDHTVLTTTTTKIFVPDKTQSPVLVTADTLDALKDLARDGLDRYAHLTIGCGIIPEQNKLIGIPAGWAKDIQQDLGVDWLIIEADGARRKPLKASADHEPVVPAQSDHIIGVTGLDAVGKPLSDDHVHRSLIFSSRTGLALGEPITEKAVAKILGIEIQRLKSDHADTLFTAFLNKADDPETLDKGKQVAQYLMAQPLFNQVLVGTLQPSARVKQRYTKT